MLLNILTANADVPHYRRTVMTSFKNAGNHSFLQPTVSLIESGFSVKTATLQRHHKHLYRIQTNLKNACIRAEYSFKEIQNVVDELPFSSERKSSNISQHLAVVNIIMPRNAFPYTKSIAKKCSYSRGFVSNSV